MRIEGAIALVTGGASGIGLEIVKNLLSKGAIVYFCDVNQIKGRDVENELNKELYEKKSLNYSSFVECDISVEEQVKSMIEIIKKKEKRIDIVINNAAIGLGQVFATKKSMFKSSDFKRLLEVNTYGAFYVSKYSAKLMIDNYNINKKEECTGNIIFISSVSSVEGMIAQSGYSASKAALNGMVLPMARDLGKYKIRVNAILPGVIKTPFISEEDSFVKSIIKSTPLNTIGSGESIAQAVEMIIKVDFINGENIRVDGGARFPMF